MDPYCINENNFARDLKNMRCAANVDALMLFGGEPLLHPNLCGIIDIAKESGIALRVMIATNGQLIDKMGDEIWDKIDGIQLTSYPGKPDHRSVIEERCRHLGKEFRHLSPSFAKIMTKSRLDNENAIKVWRNCDPGGGCMMIMDGMFYWCVQFYYLPLLLKDPVKYGLPLEGLTPEALFACLDRNQSNPSEPCRRCTGLLHRGEISWCECRNKTAWYEGSTAEGI
jgi:hypothetical protein